MPPRRGVPADQLGASLTEHYRPGRSLWLGLAFLSVIIM
jgi:hypothetical protein